jgi:hypothetical protein
VLEDADDVEEPLAERVDRGRELPVLVAVVDEETRARRARARRPDADRAAADDELRVGRAARAARVVGECRRVGRSLRGKTTTGSDKPRI